MSEMTFDSISDEQPGLFLKTKKEVMLADFLGKPSPKKVTLSVSIEEDIADALKKHARKHDMKVSTLINNILGKTLGLHN